MNNDQILVKVIENPINGLLTTLFAGVIVFLVSQIIMELSVKPYSRFKELQGEVAYVIRMHSNRIHNPIRIGNDIYKNQDYINAQNEIRGVASKVFGYIQTVPFVHLGIPSRKDLMEASTCLIFISNAFVVQHQEIELELLEKIDERIKIIYEKMRIQEPQL